MSPRSERTRLWLRWSRRDLRARWLLVVSIAMIIGLGTGLFAGLGSTAEWRRLSNDASFAQLRLHDVRLQLEGGSTVVEGELLALLDDLPDPDVVEVAEERLVVDTQIDASVGDTTVLVAGQINGAGTAATPPVVDQRWVALGEDLPSTEPAEPVVLLDRSLGRHHDLPPAGTLVVAGGRELTYTGQALQPEWFYVADPRGGVLSGSSYGVLFTTLAGAQALADLPGQVNDLVVAVAPDADADEVAADLEAVVAETGSGDGASLAATVTTRDDVPSYTVLYDDIEGDQRIWNTVSLIVLAGAAFAAANLVNRIVEAQRREIGIGMAVGARPAQLAVRPLLVGVQVGLLGVVLGIGVGLVIDRLFQGVLDDILPLPTWLTPFQPGTFARAALLGFTLPVLATILPVVRAVRVQPVDALRTTKPPSGRAVLGRLSRRVHLRGPTVRLLPLRDLVRAPRRTLFTAVGIAAAISVLVGVMGMMDSFFAVVDRSETELTGGLDQVSVDLEGFVPVDAPLVAELSAVEGVAEADPSLILPVSFGADGATPLDGLVEVLDLTSEGETAPAWRPSVVAGAAPGVDEILLSRKAAADLGVGVGDTIQLEHLQLGDAGLSIVTSNVVVSGLHGNPLRAFAYMDEVEAERFGLAGMVNELRLTPEAGVSAGELQRAVFGQPGVSAARSVRTVTDLIRQSVEDYLGLLRVVELVPIGLALLVAFNSTTIGADERRRDHATMFAFGLQPPKVLGLLTIESFVTGVLGTLLGIAGGWVLVSWVMGSIASETLPDVSVDPVLSATTLVVAFVGGVVVVTAAPALVYRRLRDLDVPASLRVVE